MRKFLSLATVLALYSMLALAQDVITGKVSDQAGQPVPFTSIRIKGSKVGVSADANGAFSIHANRGDVLVLSGAGMQTTEFRIENSATINVQMTRQDASMTEVVVTALGI